MRRLLFIATIFSFCLAQQTYDSEIQPIWDANCTRCHGSSGDLNLTQGVSYSNIVNVASKGYSGFMLVKPGDHMNSVMHQKIVGNAAFGDRMPKNSTALSNSDENKIKKWIEDGALMDWSGNPNKPNLVGHWPFNEGSGSDVYDMTTNLNNGISIGATWSTDTPGVGNLEGDDYSLSFDGNDDYVKIITDPDLPLDNSPRTVSAWIKDDNSPDGTSSIVSQKEVIFKNRVFLIKRLDKKGLGTAYIEGFRWALKRKYDFIVSMDADFSHNPSELTKMIKYFSNGVDVVVGSRYLNGVSVVNWPIGRIFLSYIAQIYVRLITGMPINDPTSGFVAYSKAVSYTHLTLPTKA